jgi:hypothetical protein
MYNEDSLEGRFICFLEQCMYLLEAQMKVAEREIQLIKALGRLVLG